MFYSSTLVLVAGSDCTKIHEYYSQLIYNSLYRTMNGGALDIMVLRSQNTIRAVERLTAAFYDLTRQQIIQMDKKNIRVTVLLDGNTLELTRKQTWEVIITGKYGKFEETLDFYRFALTFHRGRYPGGLPRHAP